MMRPLAITMGDPAGIGGEMLLRLWAQRDNRPLPDLVVLDDPQRLEKLARQMGLQIGITVCDDDHIAPASNDLRVLPIGLQKDVIPGQPDQAHAGATITSIETAVDLALRGAVSGIVTNPIAKSVLYQAGFGFPGHTEFLAWLCRSDEQTIPQPVMMLAAPMLRTVPVTVHQPLKTVSDTLTRDHIMRVARIVDHDLRTRFGIPHPNLAFAGLNPHAGEDGTMGNEEDILIRPAIEALAEEGLNVSGPWPADTLFHAARRESYDVVIAMYHDQALIPVKTLAFDQAVNVTLGLPVIRTSPDHGTAFDIAGKGIANPDSLYAAIHMAADMARHRNAA